MLPSPLRSSECPACTQYDDQKSGTLNSMNSWRYVASRVRDATSGEEMWEIRELYLEEDGRFSYTANAVAPAGNSISELQRDLDNMLNDSRLPYLDLTGGTPLLVEMPPA